MNQISSLKTLKLFKSQDIVDIPKPEICLTGLSNLVCDSGICPNLFNQLSRTCHNIQILSLVLADESDELKRLISLQTGLKRLELIARHHNWTAIIPSLTSCHHTLERLYIHAEIYWPPSFLPAFKNLRELIISTEDGCREVFSEFESSPDITFSSLQVLKITGAFPKDEGFTRFLANNGRNLIEFDVLYLGINSKWFISRSCPNLKRFFTKFEAGGWIR